MSAMRRAARGLVETRTERIDSLHSLEESKRRLQAALDRVGASNARLETSWAIAEAPLALVATFAPSPRTQSFLKALSFGMALLMAASAWALLSADETGSARFLLPMITALAMLGFPILVLGLASQREAEEARLLKAIRVALLDESEKFPPAQRWQDED